MRITRSPNLHVAGGATRRRSVAFVVGAVAAAVFLTSPTADAQELEARTYANAPVGLNFLALGYGFSTGNIAVDPALPVEGLNSDVHLGFVRYARTIDFFGASGKIKASLPFASAHWEGVVTGVGFRERDASGLGDARFTLEVNFVGAPPLSPREFAGFRQTVLVGASILVAVPTGDYDSTKLLNLGSNRWTFRPELGVSVAVVRWTLEATGTVWLYTDNDDFFGGLYLEQRALYALQGHVIYNFRPGFWIGFDAGYADGGRTTIDGDLLNTLQKNSRVGATLTYPFGRRHGIRVGFSSGVTTAIGADFNNFLVGYQYMWGAGM